MFKFNIGDIVLFNGNEHQVISRFTPAKGFVKLPVYLISMVGAPVDENQLTLV